MLFESLASMPSVNGSEIFQTLETISDNTIGNIFTFGTVDYAVFAIVFFVSAGIGVYFGFFSDGEDTTEEYLLGGKKMKTIPIAISLIARWEVKTCVFYKIINNHSFSVKNK